MRADIVPIDASELRASRFPPFGREVADAIAARKPLNLYIFAGSDAWARAKRRREARGPGTAIVIPADAEPGAFDWTFLRGQTAVLAIEAITPGTRAAYVALAAELIGAGLRFVAASDGRETFSARPQARAV